MVLYSVTVPNTVKTSLDISSMLTPVVAWLGVLSTVLTIMLTVLSIIWLGIRLWEWYQEKKR